MRPMFDPLVQELRSSQLMTTGELVTANYFRTTISPDNLLPVTHMLHQHGYHLTAVDHQSGTVIQPDPSVEFFFTQSTQNRSLLLVVEVNSPPSKVLASLARIYPTALVWETIITEWTGQLFTNEPAKHQSFDVTSK